jgi:hypothetical protein
LTLLSADFESVKKLLIAEEFTEVNQKLSSENARELRDNHTLDQLGDSKVLTVFVQTAFHTVLIVP